MIASTGSTTTVLAVLLVLIGLVMIGTAVWLVRSTRRDAPALGPLEVMGDRRFARATPDERVATLAGARPPDARPPAPMVPFDDESESAVAAGPEPVVGSQPPPVDDGAVGQPEIAGQAPDVDPTLEVTGPAAAEAVDAESVVDLDERVPAPEST